MNIYPDAYFKRVEDINIEFLNKHKIKALLLDVDRVLSSRPPPRPECVVVVVFMLGFVFGGVLLLACIDLF